MQHRWVCFISIIMVLLFSASAKAEIYTTPDEHKVEITLIPDKKEILLHEPIYLSLEIKNLSGEEICFVDGGDYRNEFGRPDSFSIEALDENGSQVQKIDSKFNFGGLISCRKIPVGGKGTVRFLTSHWLEFGKSGSFSIFCQKNMIIRKYENNINFDMAHSPAVDVKVKSEVVVKPYNDNQMGEIIKSVGDDIFTTDNAAKRSEEVTALTFINNNRVIGYFIRLSDKIAAGDPLFSSFKFHTFRALAKFDDESAFNTIIKNIASTDNDLRREISISLSSCAYPKAEEYLLSMRNDTSYAIRLDVVHYLGKTKTAKSTEVLKTMINDDSSDVRNEARRYLKERGEMIN